jgi:hypothetical protein
LSSVSTATCEITCELLQVSFQESIDSLSYSLNATAVENIDSRLVETHERPHANSASDKDPYPVLGQVIDRGHASALLVGYVRQGPDTLDFPVRDFHEGIEIAVPEVSAKG